MQNVRCLPRLPKDLQFPTDPDRITGDGLHFHGWVIKPSGPELAHVGSAGAREKQSQAHGKDPGGPMLLFKASFLFLYFSKKIFTEIYFLQFYTPTARQGAAGTST